MKLPDAPEKVADLDLLKRLDAYASGKCNWHSKDELPEGEKRDCRTLHSNLIDIITKLISPILDQTTAREMHGFTMHDRRHAQKVAHLMWHILKEEYRIRLSPPDIALMVLSAYIHDIGMALSADERETVLSSIIESKVVISAGKNISDDIFTLAHKLEAEGDESPEVSRNRRILEQAREAILCDSVRMKHASRERIEEVLDRLQHSSEESSVQLPILNSVLSYGDSFREQLVEICVSHAENSDVLVSASARNSQQRRFPIALPCGSACANVQLVASTLRLADILDFDRERTPPVLLHHLFPRMAIDRGAYSVIEWGKHLAISSWEINMDAIVYKARCKDHIVHDAIVHFCEAIRNEIASTRRVLTSTGGDWPFVLPVAVEPDIHADGYEYISEGFRLDKERIYNLLLGDRLYDNRLVAIRELIQNAVDACMLRDAITRLEKPAVVPVIDNRIRVRYEEANSKQPRARLIVDDTGIGMDDIAINEWFLSVGKSYYKSDAFSELRMKLASAGVDFAPVSEFGIGFLSVFLLADTVIVETSPWEPRDGNTDMRRLVTYGPARLVRKELDSNERHPQFVGTRVTLLLGRNSDEVQGVFPPTWLDVKSYLIDICVDLPYKITLEHLGTEGLESEIIGADMSILDFPEHLSDMVITIPIRNDDLGFDGTMSFVHPEKGRIAEKTYATTTNAVVEGNIVGMEQEWRKSALLRGGFKVGFVPGLPAIFNVPQGVRAIVRMTWKDRNDRGYLSLNLARDSVYNNNALEGAILKSWVCYIVDNYEDLPRNALIDLYIGDMRWQKTDWLFRYSPNRLYQVARESWNEEIERYSSNTETLQKWERGDGILLNLPSTHYLVGFLVNTVLPMITDLVVSGEAGEYKLYIQSPNRDWESRLLAWPNDVQPSWGFFAKYSHSISDIAYYTYPGNYFLNAKFEKELRDCIDKLQIHFVSNCLYDLHDAYVHGRQAIMSNYRRSLLSKVREALPKLKIGQKGHVYMLGDIPL